MFKFFNHDVLDDFNYKMISVYHKGTYYCASYYKGDEEEYLTSINTGERFYNLYSFVFSIKGLERFDEWECSYYYDEKNVHWIPIEYLKV